LPPTKPVEALFPLRLLNPAGLPGVGAPPPGLPTRPVGTAFDAPPTLAIVKGLGVGGGVAGRMVLSATRVVPCLVR